MRDKLIELIKSGTGINHNGKCDICQTADCIGCLADHLIAHGVTVQTDVPDIIVGNKKPLTNGDRIRAMSDEELAYWMTHLHEDGHCLNERCQLFQDNTCEECVIDWLKQPAKEEA